MPKCVTESFREELVARDLFDAACTPFVPDKQLFGGTGEDDQLKHFTHRFQASAARASHVVLNPNGTFEPISTDLLASLFDGPVALLDVPCGSGGGLFGLLGTVADLRENGCLPRLPTDVSVLGGDLSPLALELHERMADRIKPRLIPLGMRLSCQYTHWDVTDSFSTAALMDKWFEQNPDCEEYVVFVSAFSRFADQHLEPVLRAFQHINERLHNKASLVAWIEPDMNQSRRTLQRLTDGVRRWFANRLHLRSPTEAEEFRYRHPFREQDIRGQARVREFSKVF